MAVAAGLGREWAMRYGHGQRGDQLGLDSPTTLISYRGENEGSGVFAFAVAMPAVPTYRTLANICQRASQDGFSEKQFR